MFKLFTLIILLFTTLFSQSDFITSQNLMQTVKYLASEELEGRLGGSEGYFKAANFMAREFEKLNLKRYENESYFQKFNVEFNEILPPCSLNLIQQGKVKKWQIADHSWPVGNPRPKSKVAADHGAKGILFVSFPNDENPQKPIGSVLHGSGEQDEDFPQLHIDLDVADDLFKNTGYSLSELQTKIDSTKQPSSIKLYKDMNIVVNTNYDKEKETVNVIGVYPGSDEKLKDEYVILGAHLDHAGQQGNEIYFPGANDNASGSAAVLEIARAFAEQNIETKRSIMFVLFSNEESGLEGAEFLTKNLPFEKEKMVAMLNMDCVAHGDSIRLGNGKSSPELWNLAKEIDAENAKMTVDATWSGGGADATPFHKIGIPTLYFVTTNSYSHLHATTDTPETLNPKLFEEITKLAFNTLVKVADGKYTREVLISNK